MNFWFNKFALAGFVAGLLVLFGIHKPLDAGAAGFAVALGIIGAVYIGTLIGPAQPRSVIIQETAAATLTILFAVMGLLIHPFWLVPGYIWHGIWDWAHHKGRFGAKVAHWYPPFCAVVDIVIGAGILIIFW